jgi:hypothetical protein
VAEARTTASNQVAKSQLRALFRRIAHRNPGFQASEPTLLAGTFIRGIQDVAGHLYAGAVTAYNRACWREALLGIASVPCVWDSLSHKASGQFSPLEPCGREAAPL